MKRFLSGLLCLLLLAGCGPAEPSGVKEVPDAEALALAVLDACGRTTDELERTDRLLDETGLDAYLTNYYGLAEGSWKDCVIYRAGGAEAFEIAVVELTPEADMAATLSGLRAYITGREGDFTGYAPEQAAMVSRSDAEGAEIALADAEAALRDRTLWARFAALFICEDAAAARTAFLRCLDGDISPVSPAPPEPPEDSSPSPVETDAPASPAPADRDGPSAATPEPAPSPSSPAPAPSVSPSPQPSPTGAVTYPGREDYVQPGIDDMTVFDSSAILSAWRSDDPEGLSEEDRAIYDVCVQVLDKVLKDGMSDYEKELAVYRWLTVNAVYDKDHYDPLVEMDPASYTPYGVLIYSKGVCLGFATTFQLFMDLCGVECITVVGAAYYSQEDHAWNMVRLNGEWYCVDATWDLDTYRFRYLNVTSDYMARTNHQWDYAHVPEATATDGGR